MKREVLCEYSRSPAARARERQYQLVYRRRIDEQRPFDREGASSSWVLRPVPHVWRPRGRQEGVGDAHDASVEASVEGRVTRAKENFLAKRSETDPRREGDLDEPPLL